MEKHRIVVGNEEGMITHKHRQKQIEADIEAEKAAEEEAKKSPYKDFVQWNRAHFETDIWLVSKSKTAYAVWKFLIHHMDNYNAVLCSYRVLQEYFSLSEDTIRKALKLLREKKYIAVLKSGTSNVYTVNHNHVWNSWGKNMQYSKFPTNIILSLSEQEKEVQLKISRQKTVELKKEEEKGQEKRKRTPQRNQQGSQSQSQLMAEFLRPM